MIKLGDRLIFLLTMYRLIESLKKVKDFRQAGGQRHPLWFILLIVIFGLMTGHLGYRALGYFAKRHQKSLTESFGIPWGKVPSYSTIRRAMMGIDCESLIEVFNQWAAQFVPEDKPDNWIAIDGKSLKSTVEHYCQNRQNFLSIVSGFCQENGLVLSLSKLENKRTSEIHCVQDMVRHMPFKNKVFTLDALHCQKATIQAILDSQNDYLIAVKKNQNSLYRKLQSGANTSNLLSQQRTEDTSHGRKIVRIVSVFDVPEKQSASLAR